MGRILRCTPADHFEAPAGFPTLILNRFKKNGKRAFWVVEKCGFKGFEAGPW
jgi:hypothetical protein